MQIDNQNIYTNTNSHALAYKSIYAPLSARTITRTWNNICLERD